jgi:replicative DNA helicase
MKILLRSVFIVNASDSEQLFLQNYHALVESGLGFDMLEDINIWKFIQDFYQGHGHLPTLQTIRSHFERVQELEVVDRLERLAMESPKTRGDFISFLETQAEDRRVKIVMELAKEMATIAQTGIDVKDKGGKNSKKFLGAVDAIRWVLDRSHELVSPTLGSRLSGNVATDGETFITRYERVKSDPQFGIGCYTGIRQVDDALKGAKRYELWIHAGFTGSLKSSLALQWAYNQMVYYRNSTLYFSLEMPYIQCMNMLYAMHTAHEKFAQIRAQLGIQDIGLDYERMKNGVLAPHEEKFLFDYVVPDFNKKSTVPATGPYPVEAHEYGDIYIEVADPDKTDFTVLELRAKAELIYSKTPFKMVVVDHVGLMSPRERYGSTTEKINEVVRDLKKLAMSFNRGMGIAVVGLAQLSREGYRAAEKNGGKYNLTHLSYANEIERSADIVTATWIDDDLKKINRGIIQCLKSRDQAPFERCPLRVEFSCRRITTDNTSIDEIENKIQAKRGDIDKIKPHKSKVPDLGDI